MWTTILAAIADILAKLFGVWLHEKEDNKSRVNLGGEQQKNKSHQANAKGLVAANEVLREDLPEGKDLIDALNHDFNANTTNT